MVDPHVPWGSWNIAVFLHIHATTASPHWLIALAGWLTEAPLFVALGLTTWQLFRHRDPEGAIRVVIAFAVALSTEAIISALAFQPRPFAAGFGPAWVQHAANNSMPSTHVTLTCIMAITLALGRRFWSAIVLAVLAAVLAWARIYVGIHWPADMPGAVISACIAVAVAAGLAQLGKRLPAYRRRGSDR
jgi:undecaprenyl-diphosphatase